MAEKAKKNRGNVGGWRTGPKSDKNRPKEKNKTRPVQLNRTGPVQQENRFSVLNPFASAFFFFPHSRPLLPRPRSPNPRSPEPLDTPPCPSPSPFSLYRVISLSSSTPTSQPTEFLKPLHPLPTVFPKIETMLLPPRTHLRWLPSPPSTTPMRSTVKSEGASGIKGGWRRHWSKKLEF